MQKKKSGPPKLFDTVLTIPIESSTKKQLGMAAEKSGETMTGYARRIITEAIQKEQ